MRLDLLNLRSVKTFVDNYIATKRPLHILILNAGIFSAPFTLSDDGFESTFQTNYLGHFYLLQCLKSLLVQSAPSRVIILAAESHRFSDLNLDNLTDMKLSPSYPEYKPLLAYNQSKLCCILMCKELHRQWKGLKVHFYAVHPGNVVCTGLSRHWWVYRVLFTMVRPFAKSKQQACACTIYCATARELEWCSGNYINNCCMCNPVDEALKHDFSRKLFEISQQMIGKAKTLNGLYT